MKKQKLRLPLVSLCLVAWIVFSANLSFGQTADKPHILLIMVDDLNDYPAFLGGHPQASTPNMDLLARRGYSFENAFCNSPICGPSRASMLTGKDTEYTKIYSNGGGYSNYPVFRDIFTTATGNPVVHTLPGHMKDVGGYYSAGFNKIFHGPYPKGFDNDYDSLELDPCNKSLSWNFYEDFRTEPDVVPVDKDGFTSMQFGQLPNSEEPNMQDTRTLVAAIELLNDYADDPADYCDKPLFLSVGFYRPHNPYFAPERFFPDNYNNDFSVYPYQVPYNSPNNLYPPNGFIRPSRVQFNGQDWDGVPPLGRRFGLSKDSSWLNFNRYADFLDPLPLVAPGLDSAGRKSMINESARALAEMSYLAALKFADEAVGKLLLALDAHPAIRDNTIIVLVSDHGYSWGGHRHHHKSGLWETDARIPFIIYDPRRPGRENRTSLVSLIDVFPTICELTGTPPPLMPDSSKYLDGKTLVPIIDDPSKFFDQPQLMAYHGPPLFTDGDCFPQYSIRSKNFRYIRYRTNGSSTDACDMDSSIIEEELYEIGFNREIDPNEWNNLASDPAYQTVKDYLAQWLPDGQLYLKQTASAHIIGAPTSCTLNNSDVINLSPQLTFSDGSPVDTMSAGITYEWQVWPEGLSISGSSLSLPVSSVTDLGPSGEFTVRLKAILPDGAFLIDQKRFYKTAQINASDFYLVKDKRTINIFLSGTVSPAFTSSWEFGNGLVVNSEIPPAHAYPLPGFYQIKRVLTNAETGCSYAATQNIFISASDFDSTGCIAPGLKEVLAVSSRQAKLRWNEVFGADSYIYRHRRSAFPQYTTWTYGSLPINFVLLDNLIPDLEYEFEIASVCGSDTSGWDFPLRVVTEPCSPPSLFSALAIDSTFIDLSWKVGAGNISKQAFRIKQIFAPASFTFLPAAVANYNFPDLEAGTQYQLASVSFCTQLDSTENYGPVSEFFFFETPTAVAKQGLETAELTLFPNPANSTLQLSWKSIKGGSADWSLYDNNGKIVQSGKHESHRGDNFMRLDLSLLPIGIYFVEIYNDGVILNKGFSVSR